MENVLWVLWIKSLKYVPQNQRNTLQVQMHKTYSAVTNNTVISYMLS